MPPDAVLLDTRQHELRDTVNRRKRKLQELYRVTCATATALKTTAPSSPASSTTTKATCTESDFLDANDVTKGRYFDAASLRRLPGAEPLFHPNGSYRGLPTPPPTTSPTFPPHVQSQPSSVSQGTTDRGPPSARPVPSTLAAPIGVNGASRPRSPISPVTDTTSKDVPAPQADVPALASIKARTPATPPADAGDVGSDASKGPDVPLAAHLTLKERLPGSGPQATAASGPENQLLQEAAHARKEPEAEAKKPQPALASASSTSESKNALANPSSQAPNKAHNAVPNANANARTSADTPAQGNKPPMRIDTSVTRPAASIATALTTAAMTPGSAIGGQASPPERMRTRVSSGAIRHKSVSEILGETPRTANHERTPSIDKTAFSPADSLVPSRRFSQVSGTPDTAVFRRRLSDLRGSQKDLSHQSMVVFARQQAQEDSASREVVPKRGALQGVDDYLLPLFLAQASGHATGLAQLLASSRKTLTTANHHLEARELRDCRILKRIYTLQSTNKWALRQPARAAEPDRTATQWDAMIAEAKWMRTDFREERKWKHAQAKLLAYACAEWVEADASVRQELQIKTRNPIPAAPAANGITPESMPNASSQEDAVPDLIPSHEDDSSAEAEEDIPLALSAPLPPAAIFSLGPDDVTFALGQTPVSQKLLSELPMYNPFKDLRDRAQAVDNRSLDEYWRKPLTNVSRWTDTKIVFPDESANKRRKISRYDYAAESEVEEKHTPLPPDQIDVAMFRPENRHIIQRLHASHAFRMPPMPIPSQDFFQYRMPSQWTRQEEDALRRLVREYAFNWSLISSLLSSSSIYSSGAERRTPWECFERWEMLEGMPNEYARHEFYKRWTQRRTNARVKHDEAQRQAQEQQSQASAGTSQSAQAVQQMQRLRRHGEPQTVERRRNNKHINIFQAMAKLAKKRETQLQKQQHMAQVAATRKANEPAQNAQRRMRTPAEFSNHKHKQEVEMRAKIIEHNRAQSLKHATAAAAGRPGAPVQPQAMPNMPQLGRGNAPNIANAQAQPAMQAGMAQAQNRLLPPGQGMMNGPMPNGTRPPVMAQNPNPYQQGPANTATNGRIVAEAARVSEQQKAMQHARQYSNVNGANQPNLGLSMPQPNGPSYQSMQAQAGKLSPAVNGQRPMSSPRGNLAVPVGNQQLSSGVVPAINSIKQSLKTMNPQMTEQQINAMATQQLNAQLHNQNRQTGPTNYPSQTPAHGSPQLTQHTPTQSQGQANNMHMMQPNLANGIAGMNSQQYAQAMRQQMNGQLHRSGSSGAHGTPRPESRGLSATPQNRTSTVTPVPPGSTPAPSGRSQSPRPTPAQVANKS